MATRDITFSSISFRHNVGRSTPADIHLGFVLEFMTERCWAVGLAVRATLPQEQLSQLDRLSRELLESAPEVLKKEVTAAIAKAKDFGDVLSGLCAANPWSITVSPPRTVKLELGAEKSVRDLTEDYAISLFGLSQQEIGEPEFDDLGEDDHHEIPPAWMLQPQYWIIPRSGERR